jgi:tetratricopeptide (TPR) repeat protein
LFSLCGDGREASSSSAVTDALTALALTNNALSQIDAGNFSEAEALLTQALELKPYGGLHRIFKHRSVAKLGMLDYSGALEDISQALALAPNYSEPYICQGDVYVAKGQYDLAEKSYLTCLEIDPSLRRSKPFKVCFVFTLYLALKHRGPSLLRLASMSLAKMNAFSYNVII